MTEDHALIVQMVNSLIFIIENVKNALMDNLMSEYQKAVNSFSM
jgi:hypothetical protein